MRFGSGRTGLLQDSTTGSIIVNQDGQHDDNIQMQSLSEGNGVIVKTYDKTVLCKVIE